MAKYFYNWLRFKVILTKVVGGRHCSLVSVHVCYLCLDDEPADYYLSELLTLLTSVKTARITDGGIYDGRMGE